MENGLGYSIFLPDNGLRLPRLTSTRESRERRENTVKHFMLRTYLSKHDTLYTTHN
ncbi:hypothetical protein K469DRAFT_721025 [Zopfia rhizophila CBS 207.26]|uniref:Uncharacterized protein n=1 Tax=Zopfia rhizophila CBS 207.26 TaxID=1314779 RepID=A0A6A6DCR4_9PEZI|nr:hypothetical protein K469DRAFT_701428 [Zopfia rhizophila CBS 207.26]KAF2177071.1 hypothetical protein K469DRAFT_721025 [Zopfia rhizophila CBS 207.26]